uniref:Uncharacterized protein n=1 Tax=Solanum lycopersicum TaxID=4081 RepID=A0A3Q7GW34_SOLLC
MVQQVAKTVEGSLKCPHPPLIWYYHGLVAAHLILRVVEELLLKENDLLLPVEAKLHVTDANSMGVE